MGARAVLCFIGRALARSAISLRSWVDRQLPRDLERLSRVVSDLHVVPINLALVWDSSGIIRRFCRCGCRAKFRDPPDGACRESLLSFRPHGVGIQV